jgi:hypothetical protein
MSEFKKSEAWRLECEARELLSWSLKDRRKQLALVWEKRGAKSAIKLQDEITRLWKIQKNQQTGQENLSLKSQKNLEQPKQIELI